MVDVSVREDLFKLSPEQLEERLSFKEWRMNNLYSIVLEDGSVVPFQANEIQKRIRAEKSGKKDIILKYRQG